MSHSHSLFASIRSGLRRVFPAFAICIGFIVLPAAALINQSGAPAKRTGAPGDGDGTPGNNGSCADAGCHNSYPVNSGVGGIMLDAPTVFNPGVPVEFVVTVHDSTRSRFGFQTTIKNAAAENVGTFELVDSNTRFATGDTNYVTHTLANSNAQWTVKWIPPAEIQEDVTIYIGGNAADGRFSAAADHTYETSAPLVYAPISGIEDTPQIGVISFDTYPNPATSDLNVSYEVAGETVVSIELFDTLGRMVAFRGLGNRVPGAHEDKIELTGLGAGVYIARLMTDGNSVSRVVVVGK